MPPLARLIVRQARDRFNYERDIDGNLRTPLHFSLDPHRFLYANKSLDMTLVAVRPTDRTGAHELKDQGYLVLNELLGKTDIEDFASIIQHPSGQEKQIAIRENQIIDMAPDRLFYKSDTAQGSSGAPVFNDQWQVIALHSAGVAKKYERGRCVDEDGNVIEDEHGRVDESDVVWLSNEGFRISTIMTSAGGTRTQGQSSDRVLFSPAYADSRQAAPAVEACARRPPHKPRHQACGRRSCAGPADQHQHQRRRGHTGCHNVDDPDVPYSAERGGDGGGAV